METQTMDRHRQSTEQPHEGLFYDLIACLDRAVLESDPDDWGRLMSRSFKRLYQLYEVEHSERLSRKLKDSLRSLLFDLRNLGLFFRPSLDVYGSAVFFSPQGDFGKISFMHDFLSRFEVSVRPLTYLPIGWLAIMRDAGVIRESQGLPISTNFLPNPELYRRIGEWSDDLSDRVSDRRWRLKYASRPSRYAYRSRTAAAYSIQAGITMIARRVRQKRDLMKRDDVLPRFLIDRFYRSKSDPEQDDSLVVGLTLKQRVKIQMDRTVNYRKLTQYEETYRPLVPNPFYRRQTSGYYMETLGSLLNFLSFLEMDLEIRSDDQRWFPFERWQRQLMFAAKLARWFLKQIEKEKTHE